MIRKKITVSFLYLKQLVRMCCLISVEEMRADLQSDKILGLLLRETGGGVGECRSDRTGSDKFMRQRARRDAGGRHSLDYNVQH